MWCTAGSRAAISGTTNTKALSTAGSPSSGFCGCISCISLDKPVRRCSSWALRARRCHERVGSADDSTRTLWRGRRAARGDSCRHTAPCRAGRTRWPAGTSRVAASTGSRRPASPTSLRWRWEAVSVRWPVPVWESSACDRRARGASVAGVDESAVPRCSHGGPGGAACAALRHGVGSRCPQASRRDPSFRCRPPHRALA